MPIRTGFVRQVSENPRHPQRTDVSFNDGWNFDLKLHTLEPPEKRLLAALCQKSIEVHRAVRVKTMDGVYGERIIAAELVPHDETGEAA